MTTTKNGYELITTKVDKHGTPIAFLNRGGEFQPWVVAWNYDVEGDYWGQGHYFSDFEDAVKWYAHYGKKNENKDKYGLLCEPKYGVGQEFSVYDDYDELKARRDELSNDGFYVTEFRYEADDDTFYAL
jgi:hypothetical protein